MRHVELSLILSGRYSVRFYWIAAFFIQYPYEKWTIDRQAILSTKIVSTDKFRKDISVAVVFQREILCKLMSCYFIVSLYWQRKSVGMKKQRIQKLSKFDENCTK